MSIPIDYNEAQARYGKTGPSHSWMFTHMMATIRKQVSTGSQAYLWNKICEGMYHETRDPSLLHACEYPLPLDAPFPDNLELMEKRIRDDLTVYTGAPLPQATPVAPIGYDAPVNRIRVRRPQVTTQAPGIFDDAPPARDPVTFEQIEPAVTMRGVDFGGATIGEAQNLSRSQLMEAMQTIAAHPATMAQVAQVEAEYRLHRMRMEAAEASPTTAPGRPGRTI